MAEVSEKHEMDCRMNRPTIPILRLFPGLPRRVFFSWAGAFLGGMALLFFAASTLETWRVLQGSCGVICARRQKKGGGRGRGKRTLEDKDCSHRNRSACIEF